MGRPNKVGLEYFSLDVKMDDEVELIKAEHGMVGFGILISMYQTIYADKGYYKKWNERNQILFSKKVSVDRSKVINIIDDCIKWDIFNKKLYNKYNILTSRRIQKQYVNATYKRTEVELIKEYLLLKEKEIDRDNISCIEVSDVGNSKTSDVSDSKSTQSNKDKELSIKDKDKVLSNNKHLLVRNLEKFQTKRFKKVLPPAERPEYDEDSMPYRAAFYLRERVKENNPRQPLPDKDPKGLEDWADSLRKLNEYGPLGAKNKGYSWEEIREIIDWCQEDEFWKTNIMSAHKLRKQITQLEMKMKNDKNYSKDKTDEAMSNLYQKYKAEEEGMANEA